MNKELTGRRSVPRNAAAMVLLSLLTLAGCGDPIAPTSTLQPGEASAEIADLVITRMRGAGTIGDGEPRGDGTWLQEFDLDVSVESGIVQGYFYYTDYSVIKSDGNPAHLVAAPNVEGTAITDFIQTSDWCVQFDGVGKLINTGELLHFTVDACDHTQPGIGLDVFEIYVPERLITHQTEYRRADMLSSGGLIATKLGVSPTTITGMMGDGTIGSGEPAGDGIWLQEFAMDVGVENGVVGGTLDYTDYSVIKEDGKPARLRAGPIVEGTAITSFVQVSDTCIDFSGTGQIVNDGELVNFWVRACDNGTPGLDTDSFELQVPDHVYVRRDLLSDGDLVRSVLDA